MHDKFSIHLRRLSISAVFLAIALTMRMLFSFEIPLFGAGSGMRIGIAGIFSIMPSILFGPVWGAMTTGASDVLGFIMRPTGTYLPQMSIVMASGGFLRGLVWLLLRNRNPKKISIIVLIFSVLLVLFGTTNWIMFRVNGVNADFFNSATDVDTSGMYIVTQWIVARSVGVGNPSATLSTMLTTFSFGPLGAGVLGISLFGADKLMSASLKKDYKEYISLMPLLIAMLAGAWWQSTLNTVLLRQHIWTSWQYMPFALVWLPRILQSTMTTTVYSYFVAMFLGVCKRQKFLRPYLR